MLTRQEILRFVQAASELGVKKIRITGGEPLMRRDLPELVAGIKAVGGIVDLSMTTNGMMLPTYAQILADAGLDRVNISLDSLLPQRYAEITGGGSLTKVLDGINAAKKANLLPIKLNMVPMRGINDNEIEPFARLTLLQDIHVRFIELMPTAVSGTEYSEKLISSLEIHQRLGQISPLHPVKSRLNGPARYYRFESAVGVIGIISAITCNFCQDCNRMRLTSIGKLKPCLFSNKLIDLKPYLTDNSSMEQLKELIRTATELKPKGHNITPTDSTLAMSQIGG
ncbi:molybdenum cofactor biosynthesis protein MoeA [Candidatus Magnetobacterium bavaricum]|uniref:Molybdenum cofactor biosynthesis protein MoeA n=1 Tax=Candidatus Magnetobacterium bavaricum TaxID=29290 RepID=A0A0F3GMD5_9BACT|nr:molybdenum cofactor biosynthesis protein MoeA [Candidatus Magnetobacterium bavaricum]